MDPATIAALSALVVKIVDWAQTKGFQPSDGDLEKVTALRKAAVSGWDAQAPKPPPIAPGGV